MSMIITRKRGDTYPIKAVIKINGEPIDLTGSDVKFSFKPSDGSGSVTTITGVISSGEVGVVMFTPTVTDFSVSGKYFFDIQRSIGSMVATHLSGILLLEDDVTP